MLVFPLICHHLYVHELKENWLKMWKYLESVDSCTEEIDNVFLTRVIRGHEEQGGRNCGDVFKKGFFSQKLNTWLLSRNLYSDFAWFAIISTFFDHSLCILLSWQCVNMLLIYLQGKWLKICNLQPTVCLNTELTGCCCSSLSKYILISFLFSSLLQ